MYQTNSYIKLSYRTLLLCTFCGEHEESLEHLFLHYRICKNFWMQIVSWLNDLNITIIELKDSEIMLGYMNESPHWLFLNHVLTTGKQVIYSSRLSKSKPPFFQFMVKLKHIERIEYFIAKKRDRCSFHEKKWKIIRK